MKIIRKVVLLLIILLTGCSLNNKVDNKYDQIPKIDLVDYELPSVVSESQKKEFKILIVEIDPVLTKGSIQGIKCAGKTASQCLGQNKNQVVKELVTDLNESSHHNLDVKIVKTEKLNEFATYKNKVELLNKKSDYRLDESTWLDIMKKGWYYGVNDKRVEKIGKWFGTYDYEYLIDKLDLVTRRNNNEFDEVWLVNVDPSLTYESMMVGSNAFWINGEPSEKECSPFKIVNVSISRPDANFECFGHATEQLFNTIFSATNWSEYDALNWGKNSAYISELEYDNLNLWQKFMLTEHQNENKNSGLVGVGNIHFSPNSTKDYEWNNKKNKVYSKYYEWSNYPQLTNQKSTKIFSSSVYINNKISGTNSDARLHHRWWFSLLPHHSGYTQDGYYNNWWNYYMSNQFITYISSNYEQYIFHVGDRIDNILFDLTYYDGHIETTKDFIYDTNVDIEDKTLFAIDEDNNLYAKSTGRTQIRYYRDGIYDEITVIIKK